MIRRIGRRALTIISGFGEYALFLLHAFTAITQTRRLFSRVLSAIFEQGVRCLPVITIVALFTGLVLGLQGYYVLNKFGSESLLGTLVSLSLIREMAPVLAALMLVGQAGSALTAEIGIQRNTEQIAALETMGINSIGFIVSPRILASLVVFPLQTAFFTVVGLWGGSLSGSLLLGVDSGVYWASIEQAVESKDIRECFTKAAIFGILTISICAFHGFNAHRQHHATGARAVSKSTTRAVVHASIIVLAADYVITSFLV